MVLRLVTYFLCFFFVSIPFYVHAQIGEEESAEVFLEDYSDAFQEKFFEALKEKGIENTDRAINLLLECKRMEPDYVVLDHELAQAYLMTGELNNALEFALECVIAEPENYWYANTLIKIMIRRNMSMDQLRSAVPLDNEELARNLTQSLFNSGNYKEALALVDNLDTSPQSLHLKSKIEDSIARQENKKTTVVQEESEPEVRNDPVTEYRIQLIKYMDENAVQEALNMAIEASETYPSQPFFYYAHGWALHQQGEHKRALRSLETGLDYLIDDDVLANSFYKILASTHKALGNASKANMYLSKVKSGL